MRAASASRRSRSGAAPSPAARTIFDPAPAASSAIHIEPTFGDPEDWKAKEILFQCLHLHYKALEFLTPQPRKICLRMIFGVITTLLGTLDHRQLERDSGNLPVRPFGADPAEVETLERELKQAQAYYESSAQRQAQLEYLVGMVMFLGLAVAGTAAIALFTPLLDEAATVSVLGGAAGAVVSVMNRMTSGSLKVRPEAGKKTIRALGFMRPVIGAVFGAVVYLFLDGGIVAGALAARRRREPRLLRRARLHLRLQRALRPGRHRAGAREPDKKPHAEAAGRPPDSR